MATGWSKSPTAFIKVVEQDLGQRRHQIAVEALAAVVAGSPEDSGASRANHRVSIDGVDLGQDLENIDLSGAETRFRLAVRLSALLPAILRNRHPE